MSSTPNASSPNPSMQNEPRLEDSVLNAQIEEHSSKSDTNTLLSGFVVVLLLLIPSTWVCGSNWGYWGNFKQIEKEAGVSLEAIPKEFGSWKAGEDEPLDQDAIEQLELSRYVVRRYVNKDNERDHVALVLLIGPTGRLTAHTPKVCFGGQNFTQDGPGRPISFPFTSEGEEKKDVMTKLVFNNNSIDGGSKIFYYGGNVGGEWMEIEDNTRYTITRNYRIMYKLQVEAFVADESAGDDDVVARFLKEFLPEIRGVLVETK